MWKGLSTVYGLMVHLWTLFMDSMVNKLINPH